MPETQCASCASTGTTASPLKKCAGCHQVSYCSRDCQRADWRQHKPACTTAAAAAAPVESANDIAYKYWNNSAHLDPEAVALVERLKLDFPNGSRGLKSGITYPLRRLTATGHDTPHNHHLLFGTSAPLSGHDRVRRHVLLHPPAGSPAHTMYSALDENCPFWTPRPPNEEEQKEVREVREMQGRIREVVPVGEEVTRDHMMRVLGGYGGDWAGMIGVYEDAVNCLDQGVRGQ